MFLPPAAQVPETRPLRGKQNQDQIPLACARERHGAGAPGPHRALVNRPRCASSTAHRPKAHRGCPGGGRWHVVRPAIPLATRRSLSDRPGHSRSSRRPGGLQRSGARRMRQCSTRAGPAQRLPPPAPVGAPAGGYKCFFRPDSSTFHNLVTRYQINYCIR